MQKVLPAFSLACSRESNIATSRLHVLTAPYRNCWGMVPEYWRNTLRCPVTLEYGKSSLLLSSALELLEGIRTFEDWGIFFEVCRIWCYSIRAMCVVTDGLIERIHPSAYSFGVDRSNHLNFSANSCSFLSKLTVVSTVASPIICCGSSCIQLSTHLTLLGTYMLFGLMKITKARPDSLSRTAEYVSRLLMPFISATNTRTFFRY